MLPRFFALLLIGSYYGASVDTTIKNNKSNSVTGNCTMEDARQSGSCLVSLTKFGAQIDKTTDRNQTSELKKTCDSLKNCFISVDCGKPSEATKKVISYFKIYCDAVPYVHEDFADCIEKMESNNSDCFKNWKPFIKQRRETACDNIFGKDGCMKKEIMEVCSEKEWDGIEKQFMAVSGFIGKCEFNGLL